MLSLAEYQAYANDIEILGQQTDQQIGDSLGDSASKDDAIKKAKTFIPPYQRALKGVMDEALLSVASNTVDHYQTQVGITLPENIARDVVRNQYVNRYYGATLAQRLVLSRLRLNRVITQTAQVGVNNLPGLFSNSIPFGAQSNISKRLLQGTAIKVEQDVAKKVADEANYSLIRWTLAKDHHKHQCMCERYARAINKDVSVYANEHNLNIKLEGVFFVDDLPDPPHPNCQCEFSLVGDSDVIPSKGFRPLHKLHRLIRKLLRS